jgi:hypothetical protein
MLALLSDIFSSIRSDRIGGTLTTRAAAWLARARHDDRADGGEQDFRASAR